MKINLPKFYDASKELQTKEGQALKDFIEFMSKTTKDIVSLVNGKLGADNTDCTIREIKVKTNQEQNIGVASRAINGVSILRVIADDSQFAGYKSFQWWLNGKSELVVKVGITNDPDEKTSVVVRIKIDFA